MNKRLRVDLLLYTIPTLLLIIVLTWILQDKNVAILNPQGAIADQQQRLLITATWLMLIVGIPVFILTFVVAWKYRKDNTKATYAPNWDYNFWLEAIWWGVPFIIIVILSVLIWNSSHKLDPFKPLDHPKKPITIQVVAMNWKWLFIYPEQKIATVNFLQIPEKTPINFEITADAPMNSFWIPQLGGQMYAMPAMVSKLHLIADGVGNYNGASANLSGKGFSGMRFVATSVTEKAFEKWVDTAHASNESLSLQSYKALAAPSENNPQATYRLEKNDLFNWIVMKYMMPMENE